MSHQPARRSFLKASAASSVAAFTGLGSARQLMAHGYRSPNERPVFGFVGMGIRYETLIQAALPLGPCAALCDVDGVQLRKGKALLDQLFCDKGLSTASPAMGEDYRRILDRNDIDAVVIAAPDHWHTKIAIEAMQSGKDVYCEKPLTLTIEEGQKIQKVLKQTGRIFQVGTQQRSGEQFQQAVGLLRDERVGEVKRITCAIGLGFSSATLPVLTPPSELNWNRWLGPAPYVPYRADPDFVDEGYFSRYPHSRSHGHFRWWYEYAGGILTDWGAHHVDIAMWALNKSDGNIGPVTLEPLSVDYQVPFKDGYPVVDDHFNTPTKFHVRVTFADGIEIDVVDTAPDLGFVNGIMFQGTEGRFFVNRGKITGKPVEELKERPLPKKENEPYQSARTEDNLSDSSKHMKNFTDSLKGQATPISDVASHHRHLSICHAANIAVRLNRKLVYDPDVEQFVGDDQANTFLAREPRKGFEITV